MTSRKAIFAALFALVSAPVGFVTKSRRAESWSGYPAANQPALFQCEGGQDAQRQPRLPTKWTFHAELVLYAHAENVAAGGDVVDLLNDLVDAVVAAIEPLPGRECQTLGGLVTDVRIDGAIETDEGRLGQQAVAIIPLIIIANA